MKKIFLFFAAALVTLSFVSCEGGGNTPKEDAFKIDVTNIEAKSAHIAVTPADSTATYYWDILDATEAAKMTDEQVAAYFKGYFDEAIEYYAQSEYELTYADLLLKGFDEYDFTSLTPNTEYAVVAIALNDSMVAQGAAVKKNFKTLEQKEDPVPADMTFQFAVEDLTFSSANVSVTPSNNAATYYWGVIATEQLAGMTDEDIFTAIKENIEYYIDLYAMFGYDMTFEDFLSKGADQYEYTDLSANTAYTVYAFAMGTAGTTAGVVAKYNFQTPEIVAKDSIELDFHDAIIYDYHDIDNSFQVVAAPADSSLVVFLNPYSDTFVGTFTVDDLDLEYSGVNDYVAQTGYTIAAADFEGVETEKGAIYTGWIICNNAVKYTFSFNAVLKVDEPASAPAKKAPAKKQLPNIKKGNIQKNVKFVSEKLFNK